MYVDAMIFESNMARRKEHYFASAMKAICENTGNRTMKYSYIDFVDDNLPEEDTRTGEEIANDVISRHGLKVKV